MTTEPQEDLEPFIEPHFVGGRFVDHTIPVEVLRDMTELQEVIVEVAKGFYMLEHGFKIGPRNLRSGVALRLKAVTEGSACAPMELYISEEVKRRDSVAKALEQAKCAVFDLFNAAAAQKLTKIPEGISKALVVRLARVGRSLRDDEYGELNPRALQGEKVLLNRSVRSSLAGLSDEGAILEEEVDVLGVVVGLDAKDANHRTLTLSLFEESRLISCRLPADDSTYEYYSFAISLLRRVEERVIVGISGLGRIDKNGEVQSVEEIYGFEEVCESPVMIRLDELLSLEAHNVENRNAFDSVEVADFLILAEKQLGTADFAPMLFLTSDFERLVLEWAIGTADATLEVDPNTLMAEYHIWHEFDDSEDSSSIDMKNSSSLKCLVDLLVQAKDKELSSQRD